MVDKPAPVTLLADHARYLERRLTRDSDDPFRVKGVLDFEGHGRRFISQAVHRRISRDFKARRTRPGAAILVMHGEPCHG